MLTATSDMFAHVKLCDAHIHFKKAKFGQKIGEFPYFLLQKLLINLSSANHNYYTDLSLPEEANLSDKRQGNVTDLIYGMNKQKMMLKMAICNRS